MTQKPSSRRRRGSTKSIHSPGRAKLLITALRVFLRYLSLPGNITIDLAASVPVWESIVAGWILIDGQSPLIEPETEIGDLDQL